MRYYAQYTEPTKIFETRHKGAWMIMDREVTSPQGDVRPIAMCSNRYIAFLIRDALNEKESRK